MVGEMNQIHVTSFFLVDNYFQALAISLIAFLSCLWTFIDIYLATGGDRMVAVERGL